MAEYIERKALLKDIKEERPENWTDSEAERQAENDFYKYREIVEIQPTADVVEVVRCKECKHYEIHRPSVTLNCEREGKLIPMNPTDFCSYGVRKEGDE